MISWPHKTGEARDPVTRQSTVAVGNDRADCRRIFAFFLVKSVADFEAVAGRRFDPQGAHHAAKFSFSSEVRHHACFGMLQQRYLSGRRASD